MYADWTWNKAELNRHNAQFLGAAAKLAYSNPHDIPAVPAVRGLRGKPGTPAVPAVPGLKTTLKKWDMDLIQFFDCEDTQGYLAGNDQTYILAFRGTQPDHLHDWLYDLNGIQIPGPIGKVHGGFSMALDKVWPDVLSALSKDRGKHSLWVTGHSLGGALAVLAVARLLFATQPQTISGLYTFGQPRVGDADFCKQFDKAFGANTFRFVNFQDIVPRVPLPNMNFGDLGTFQYFNEQEWVPKMTWSELLLHNIGDTIHDIVALNDINDHMMDRYLEKLQRLAGLDDGIRHQ